MYLSVYKPVLDENFRWSEIQIHQVSSRLSKQFVLYVEHSLL